MRVGGKWPRAIPRNDPASGVSSLAVLWRRDAVTERLVRGGSQGRRELLKPPPGRAPLCLLPHGPVYAGGGSGALFPLLKLLAENEPLWSVGKASWYILERATLFQGPRKLEAGDSSTHHLSGRLHVARRCNHAGDARPLDILPLLSACRLAGAPPLLPVFPAPRPAPLSSFPSFSVPSLLPVIPLFLSSFPPPPPPPSFFSGLLPYHSLNFIPSQVVRQALYLLNLVKSYNCYYRPHFATRRVKRPLVP